jgi:hypothetical protein
MTRYRLNDLPGEMWVWDAESEDEATKLYMHQCFGVEAYDEYIEYCEEVGVDPKIEWTVENE